MCVHIYVCMCVEIRSQHQKLSLVTLNIIFLSEPGLVHSARLASQFALGIPLPPSSMHWDLLVGRLAWGFKLWPHARMANALLAELSPSWCKFLLKQFAHI